MGIILLAYLHYSFIALKYFDISFRIVLAKLLLINNIVLHLTIPVLTIIVFLIVSFIVFQKPFLSLNLLLLGLCF